MSDDAKKLVDVKCVSNHAENLADGQLLGVGEIAKADLGEAHNKALLTEGRIIEIKSKKGDGK